MKFIIERTSQWGCETPPIEGATRELVTRYDYRTAGVKENKSAWEDFNRWSTDLEPLPNGEWRGKRKDKEKAQRVFAKLNPSQELLQKMLSAIQKSKMTDDWQKQNGQYIPYPATWLNGRRWEDEGVILESTPTLTPEEEEPETPVEPTVGADGFSYEDKEGLHIECLWIQC